MSDVDGDFWAGFHFEVDGLCDEFSADGRSVAEADLYRIAYSGHKIHRYDIFWRYRNLSDWCFNVEKFIRKSTMESVVVSQRHDGGIFMNAFRRDNYAFDALAWDFRIFPEVQAEFEFIRLQQTRQTATVDEFDAVHSSA